MWHKGQGFDRPPPGCCGKAFARGRLGDRHDSRQGRQRGDSHHNRAQDWIPADGETQGRERCHGAGKDGGEAAAIQGMGAHDNLGQRHGIRQA